MTEESFETRTTPLGVPALARQVVGLSKDLSLGVGKLPVALLRAQAPPGAPIHAHGEDLANHVTRQY